jgi:hypothetical protein
MKFSLGKDTTMLQSMFLLRVYIQPTHNHTAQSSSLSEMRRELSDSQAAIPTSQAKTYFIPYPCGIKCSSDYLGLNPS